MPDADPPILRYADRDVGRWLPVTPYRNEAMIHVAASMLEDAGIRTFIEDHPVRAGGSRPARVYVPADDAAAAAELLNRAALRHIPNARVAKPPRSAARLVFLIIQLLILALLVWLVVL